MVLTVVKETNKEMKELKDVEFISIINLMKKLLISQEIFNLIEAPFG
jgi:hypothetical protein